LKELLHELLVNGRDENAMFTLMKMLPCIMHLENRVGLKILTMLLLDGLSYATKGNIATSLLSKNNRGETYIHKMEKIVQEQLLGDELRPSHWVISI
jgi:hypothetical protein